MSREERVSFIAGFGVLALLGVLVLEPVTAAASPPLSCVNTKVNVEGTNTGEPENTHTGIKANVHFATSNGDCFRVSSIGLVNSDGTVEVGWALGWIPYNGNVYTGSGACNDHYFTDPEVFEVWEPIGGDYHCRELKSEVGGLNKFYVMSISDPEQDTIWKVTEGGANLDLVNVNVNFSEGDVRTNGERHNLTIDTSKAEFKSLYERINSLGTLWIGFCCSDQAHPGDNDPAFHWQMDAADHTEVVHD